MSEPRGDTGLTVTLDLDAAKSPVYDDEIYSHHVYASHEAIPFSQIESLGHGSFGHVDKVIRKDGPLRGRVYARKTIIVPLDGAAQMIQDALDTEVGLIKKARHPHVVSVTETYVYGRNLAIIMTPVAPGNLETYLHAVDRLPMDETGEEMRDRMKPWFVCLVNGLAYLHNLGIRHRDIKPANILVTAEKVLLADFGIAVEYQGNTISTTTDPVGTKLYRAPEVSDSIRSGRPADVFSLGAVFLEMFSVCGSKGLLAKLKDIRQSGVDRSYSGNLDKIFEWIDRFLIPPLSQASASFVYLSKQMLHKKRTHRPSAGAVQTCLSYGSLFALLKCSCKSGPFRIESNPHNTGGTETNLQNAAVSDLSLVKELLRWSNRSGRYMGRVLLEAAEYDHETVVFYLLQHGVDIEQKDDIYREMALHRAVRGGHAGVVRLLLSHGAQVNVKNSYGHTALYLGALNGHELTVRELVENGADFQKHQGETRVTPLMAAAGKGHEGTVLFLLKHGTNINAQSLDGWTALHYAAFHGKEEVVRLLLEESADINIQAYLGETALDLAIDNGHEGVVRLLRSAQMSV
jgi:serine/threonine protein kinase